MKRNLPLFFYSSRFRMCSLETRGFWLELYAILREHKLASFCADAVEFSRLASCSPGQAAQAIAELERQGVVRVLRNSEEITLVDPELEELLGAGYWRKLAGPITRELRKRVFARDGWRCKRCGSLEDLTIDHIRPVAKLGRTIFKNLQTLCGTCNSSKGDRWPEAASGGAQ